MCFGNTLSIDEFFNSPPLGESLKFFADYRQHLAGLKARSRIIRYTFVATTKHLNSVKFLEKEKFDAAAHQWIHGYREHGQFQPFLKSSTELARAGLRQEPVTRAGYQYLIMGRRHNMTAAQQRAVAALLPDNISENDLAEIQLYKHFAGTMHDNPSDCRAVEWSKDSFKEMRALQTDDILTAEIAPFPRIETGYRPTVERNEAAQRVSPVADFVAFGWHIENTSTGDGTLKILAILAGDVDPGRDAVRLKLVHGPKVQPTEKLLNALLPISAYSKPIGNYL